MTNLISPPLLALGRNSPLGHDLAATVSVPTPTAGAVNTMRASLGQISAAVHQDQRFGFVMALVGGATKIAQQLQ